MQQLSEYERQRELNITRNEEYLKEIGLFKDQSNRTPSRGKRKVTTSVSAAELQPVRRSVRVSSLHAPNYQEDRITGTGRREKEVTILSDDLPVGTEVDTNKFLAAEGDAGDASGGSGRCNDIDATLSVFLDKDLSGPDAVRVPLCSPVEDYGKAAVMALSNGGALPRFSKYAGAVEWRNSVYLWVNIGGSAGSDYVNTFSEGGRHMMWYGGSRMRPDSAVVQRLLRAKRGDTVPPWSAREAVDTVLLFARLEGEGYCCLGRVRWVAADLQSQPVRFKWELLDYAGFKEAPQFKRILQASGGPIT